MDEYFHRREELIALDRARRVDSSTTLKDVSQLLDEADAIFRVIRTLEEKSVWSETSIAAKAADDTAHIFPGMGFLTARDIIVGTDLFNIVCKMPKGALLHAHLDATVNAKVLLQLVLKHSNIHVRVTERLTPGNLASTVPEFRPFAAQQLAAVSLAADNYQPSDWIPFSLARENFPSSMGGPSGFDKWFLQTLTISPAEAYKTHNTTQKIWAKFGSTFLIAHPLIYYAPIWREYIREFFYSSIEDGISYVEVRINFHARYMFGEDGEENIPHRDWLREYDRVMSEVKADLKEQGREDEFIIYTALRFITPEQLEWYLEDCIALKQEFPHLIAGFDLVAHEDPFNPLIEYIVPLTQFVTRTRELGLDIPFIFHAGETLGDGTAADMNLYDAILLGTKRIGHGFSLIKHPKLIEICREKSIAVEVCPISYVIRAELHEATLRRDARNEILRLTSSMPMHPLPAMMNHGVPVTLCSDDPAVFGNMGLSFDFFQVCWRNHDFDSLAAHFHDYPTLKVVVASEVTGLITIGELARGSFKYCCLTEDEKNRASQIWDKKWRAFLECGVKALEPATRSDGAPLNTRQTAMNQLLPHWLRFPASTLRPFRVQCSLVWSFFVKLRSGQDRVVAQPSFVLLFTGLDVTTSVSSHYPRLTSGPRVGPSRGVQDPVKLFMGSPSFPTRYTIADNDSPAMHIKL
ncbi:hypothetical protein NM688_g5331 [Phlebia brevispora]|uniref:Uncharacterized protein n=1 Tax=Phlebia brevispora TaxID=194682 RepID=A0ACC1SX39_9APHY|nr:hypothetical protein NM688_g5331 [Phlebia brevispora]